LFIGRLVSLKGIADLLQAWPQVTSRVPGMQLVIAGDGAERDKVAAAAAKNPSIHPVGRLSGNDVWSAYAAADFAVAPSHFEPWGLVANEAMAAGTPIIVTDVFGCVGDLAQDAKTALVVPVGVPERLADAMSRLALDANLRSRLSYAASEIIADWTIENQAKNITEIWRRVLGESRCHGDSGASQALA
jgi:glycosyltransferase involved in cell wall biosynthesis